MGDDIKVGFFSDFHKMDALNDVSDADAEALVYAVNDADLDVLVILGDHGASGTREELEEARYWYNKMDVDTVVEVPGNHDMNIQGIGLELSNIDNYVEHARINNDYDVNIQDFPFVFDVADGVRVLLINTVAEGVPLARGAIGEKQLDKIERELNKDFNGVFILAGHHCPSADGRGLSWTRALSDRRELEEVLLGSTASVLGVFGHVHSWREWSGVLGFKQLRGTPMAKEGFWIMECFNGGISWNKKVI